MLLLFFLIPHAISVAISDCHYVQITLFYLKWKMYELALQIGTPSQSVANIVLDTGSSDLVITESSFNFNLSTTFSTEWDTLPYQYGSTEIFSIYVGADTVRGTGFRVDVFDFGTTTELATIDDFNAVLGVGYYTTSAIGDTANFPLSLVRQGVTKSNIYSLNGQPSEPSVIFGGIHRKVFQPPLFKTPIGLLYGRKGSLDYYSFIVVTVNSIKLGDIVISSQNLIYSLDTGNNGFITTQPIYDNLMSLLSPKTVDNKTYVEYDKLLKAKLTFDITGYQVSIPLLEIVDEVRNIGNEKYASLQIYVISVGEDNNFQGGIPNCVYKYMYTVFDLDNNQVLLAPYSANSRSKPVAILDPNSYPVATTTKKEYTNTYRSLYTDSSETTVSGGKHEANYCRPKKWGKHRNLKRRPVHQRIENYII